MTPRPYDALSEIEWSEVERVRDLLANGELETARAALERLQLKRPSHPDLKVVDALLSLEEGEAEQALHALEGAERAADPAEFFALRSAAQYDLVRFAEARADAERALAVHPNDAHAHDLLSRILEKMGDAEGSAEHAVRACELDPEGFPLPLDVPREEFDALVERSVAELPQAIRAKLDELPVLVQDLPTPDMLTGEDPPLAPDLLGLFVGHHLFARSVEAPPSAPGAIYLFRRNLLRACADREELEREIRITVQHEVGHLLGLDEDDLDQWGLA